MQHVAAEVIPVAAALVAGGETTGAGRPCRARSRHDRREDSAPRRALKAARTAAEDGDVRRGRRHEFGRPANAFPRPHVKAGAPYHTFADFRKGGGLRLSKPTSWSEVGRERESFERI